MMKDPTNRAMPAKTSRKVVKNPSPAARVASVSSARVAPVTASAVGGSTAATPARRAFWVTPRSAVIEKEETVPSGANAARAVASSTSTAVAPNNDPNSTSPLMVTVRVWSPMTAWVVSPTDSPDLVRVELSTAT
jgi:hypothetical protein